MVQSFGLSHLWVNPSQFSLLPNFFPPVVTGNFSWTITDEHQSLEPYYVVFRTEEDELGQGNNCGKTSYQVLKININEPITSLDTKENFEFKIFPNPLVHQQLQLEIPTEFISKQCSYKIINLHGQVLKEGNLKPGKHIQTIDIQQFSGGVYSFILQSNNKMGVQKFVKLK